MPTMALTHPPPTRVAVGATPPEEGRMKGFPSCGVG